MNQLHQKKCLPCEAGNPPLTSPEIEPLLSQINPEWEVVKDNTRLKRVLKFPDFNAAMAFLNQVGDLAESEGHHPDFSLKNYNRVKLKLTTHKIGGLSENDFILAAKIDRLLEDQNYGI